MTSPAGPEKATSGCPFHRAAKAIAEISTRSWQPRRPDGSRPRAFHDKTHACLRGAFHVEPPADARWRHGVFATRRSYPALVRFSSSLSQRDWEPDPRGLAIKLRDVEGDVCEGAPPGQQDFVLANQSRFGLKNADDALCLFSRLDGRGAFTPAKAAAPGFIFASFRPDRIRWYYLASVLLSGWNHLRCRDLLRFNYYSMTPYRLGEGAVKYQLHPESAKRLKARGRTLQERLQFALDRGPVSFGFHLQPRLSEAELIDDATQLWQGPTLRAGRLEIIPQDVAATVPLGDALTFSPWNCLRAHTPLGSINLARKFAYRLSAETRGARAEFPAEEVARRG